MPFLQVFVFFCVSMRLYAPSKSGEKMLCERESPVHASPSVPPPTQLASSQMGIVWTVFFLLQFLIFELESIQIININMWRTGWLRVSISCCRWLWRQGCAQDNWNVMAHLDLGQSYCHSLIGPFACSLRKTRWLSPHGRPRVSHNIWHYATNWAHW